MNQNNIFRTARLALASAYILMIPTYLVIFPPRLNVLFYLGYCVGPALFAVAAAASLIWLGRYTPLVCILLPAWTVLESFGFLFATPDYAPRWYPLVALLYPLAKITMIVFLYSFLKFVVAAKTNVQQSVAGAPSQGVGSPEP